MRRPPSPPPDARLGRLPPMAPSAIRPGAKRLRGQADEVAPPELVADVDVR